MTAATSSGSGSGGRIVFHRGRVTLTPPAAPPPGWAPARYSVISPGTERRRLAATRSGPDHAAGYMTMSVTGNGSAALASVPHGSAVDPTDPHALMVDADVPVEAVAVARFQLMAALGLRRLPSSRLWADQSVAVVGSGPVAVGCVLELLRLGATSVQVLTTRSDPPVATLPGATVCPATPPDRPAPEGHRWPVVIDCVGRPEHALALAAPGGFLGLLGTPDDAVTLPAADVHRSGVIAVGMHELAGTDATARCLVFREILTWVGERIEREIPRSWCQRVPAEQAVGLYHRVFGQRRPPQPFLILDWSS